VNRSFLVETGSGGEVISPSEGADSTALGGRAALDGRAAPAPGRGTGRAAPGGRAAPSDRQESCEVKCTIGGKKGDSITALVSTGAWIENNLSWLGCPVTQRKKNFNRRRVACEKY
jgi:hypothetical protein